MGAVVVRWIVRHSGVIGRIRRPRIRVWTTRSRPRADNRHSSQGRPFRPPDASFERSQFQPVTPKCGACARQQHPKASFHQQVPFDSQPQPCDLGAIENAHAEHANTAAGGGDVQKRTPKSRTELRVGEIWVGSGSSAADSSDNVMRGRLKSHRGSPCRVSALPRR